MGFLGDNIRILASAIVYLQDYEQIRPGRQLKMKLEDPED